MISDLQFAKMVEKMLHYKHLLISKVMVIYMPVDNLA